MNRFRHVIESLRRKPRALLHVQLQADIRPGEAWHQLWRQLLAALPPEEAAKVMVDALHVAARTGELASVRVVEMERCHLPGRGGSAAATWKP